MDRLYIDRATFEGLLRDQREAGRIMNEYSTNPKFAGQGWEPKKKR
jgi:hypothetical protein